MTVDRQGCDKKSEGVGAWWLVLLLPLACCGLPLLLAAVGTGAFAALWAKGYGYAAVGALAVAAGALVYVRVRRTAASGPAAELCHTGKAAAGGFDGLRAGGGDDGQRP